MCKDNGKIVQKIKLKLKETLYISINVCMFIFEVIPIF